MGYFAGNPMEVRSTAYFTVIPDKKKTGSCIELRLNSPLVKFKITNMADVQVNFTPEDIFSASFCEKETEKLTVAQLKLSPESTLKRY